MKPLNVLSLFDGCGTGLLALKRAGIPVAHYYASEVDKYAIQIAKNNHPEIEHIGDVKQVWARNLPKIDLLIGGSPCQDLSVAKQNRQGLKGQRSGLFWHYVRLLRTTKSRWFLLENVASMSQADRDQITKILGAEPILINSALVSAQQRKRLYWTNIPNITQPEDRGILFKDVLDSGIPTEDKAHCIDANYWKTLGKSVLDNTHARNSRPRVFEALYSPYDQIIRTDKSAALGTGCAHFGNRTGQVVLGNLYNGTIHLEKSGTLGTGRGLTTKTSQCVIARATDFPFKTYTVKDKQVILKKTAYKIDLPDGNYTIRKLTPTECERLQTLPDGYTEGVSNTQRYKMLGNGWTADVIAHIFSFIPKEN
nr:MAG TPA: Cytosine specific methyltransferase [Caudoviricetes sp.]